MYENKLNNILKISTILIVLLCSKNLLAQDVTLSLNLKNVTVKEALEQLKNDTKFSLWFNVNDVELSKIVTVQLENKSIEDALKIILDGQNLNFEVKNKRIQIFKHKTNVEKPKQKVKNITGLVTDESGDGRQSRHAQDAFHHLETMIGALLGIDIEDFPLVLGQFRRIQQYRAVLQRRRDDGGDIERLLAFRLADGRAEIAQCADDSSVRLQYLGGLLTFHADAQP